VHKRKWMKISSTNPPLHDGWPQSLYSISVYICMGRGSIRGKHWLEIWQSHGLRHFSGLWNLLRGLHNEIILVGPSMVTTEQNSDPTKYNGLSSTICKGGHYILHHESSVQRESMLQQCGREDTTYTIPYREPSFVQSKKSMSPCAILCIMQFVVPSAIDICPLWIKKIACFVVSSWAQT
jgi:hypothetical protein